jgi:hypothetical protein
MGEYRGEFATGINNYFIYLFIIYLILPARNNFKVYRFTSLIKPLIREDFETAPVDPVAAPRDCYSRLPARDGFKIFAPPD